MKILLAAVNAKYIHSNLAVYSLKSYAKEYKKEIEIAEYTINQYQDEILMDIYKRKPDVVAFSCYIWNIELITSLIRDYHRLEPSVPVWVGGPEVSYDAENFLKDYPEVTGVMTGEGEMTFKELAGQYCEACYQPAKIDGIVYRKADGEIITNKPRPLLNINEIPFIYEDLSVFKNKILYYESSRGCPYSCSYCLSSIEKTVRFRSIGLVKQELKFFLDAKVPQVKFIDRTFNCRHNHSLEIWKFLLDNDNGITNFHFEIAADLLNAAELLLMAQMRPGLIQLEIGVQSTNPETLQEIDRVMGFTQIKPIVERITEGRNIHQHLDLIAGLPFEDYNSFGNSFNDIYSLRPDQFQLGFLKVLKGSKMHDKSEAYGLIYHSQAPYEVMATSWLSYDKVIKLKGIEQMIDMYYNSSQFTRTLPLLEEFFDTPFSFYEKLADYFQRSGFDKNKPSRQARYDLLLDFACLYDGGKRDIYKELLTFDLYLRENLKSRPDWASDQTPFREEAYDFYKNEEKTHAILPGYKGYNSRQLKRMTHIEVFSHLWDEPAFVLFDYQCRNPLNLEARTIIIR